MKELRPTSQFKKDYKKIKNQPKKRQKLFEILNKLANEMPIPQENRPHPLKGRMAGYMECHIESDFLLIWNDPNTNVIELVRLGSHSELFGNT